VNPSADDLEIKQNYQPGKGVKTGAADCQLTSNSSQYSKIQYAR
jgi:hypothetical protein